MKEQKHLRCKLISRVSFILLFILLTALFDVAMAQGDNITLELVGQVGGPTQAVAVQGNYAYVGVGLRLEVLDVSDPTTPTVVGTTEPFPNFVEDVAVSGTVAYVAAGGAGMYMLNISDPANPSVTGIYDTPGYAEGVAVDGRYAYVADGPYGLRIVDISDPMHPTEITFAYPLNYVFDIAVDGQYVYLAAAGAGLLVVNISNPTRPIEIGTYDTPGYAYGVTVAENVVYIADGWEGLRVVNVSDPAHPVEVGAYDTPGWAFGVDVVGSIAYVADAFGGLQVLDVTNPTHPAELGGFEVSGGHAGSVVIADSTAFVADRNWGLWIVDVSNPVAPIQLGFYSPLGYARDVVVTGNYAYVAAGTYGLKVVEVSDPPHPVQVGIYDTQGYAISVEVAGNYAYVATTGSGVEALHVVDISNPAQPIRTGLFQGTMGQPRDMAFAEGIVYMADEFGLRLISVDDPIHPTQLGFIELGWVYGEPPPTPMSVAIGVAVSGNLAYVAVDHAGLKIVDVSDPSDPKLIGVTPHFAQDFAQEVAVAGGYAYVTSGKGLRVVNVSDPTHPAIVGSYDTPGEATGIVVLGDTAYVADGGGGLQVVNVSDPPNPIIAGSYNTPGNAHKVAIVGNHAYVADGYGGMLILEITSNSGVDSNLLSVRLAIPEQSSRNINRFPAQFSSPLRVTQIKSVNRVITEQGDSSVGYQLGKYHNETYPVHPPHSGGLAFYSSSSGRTLTVTSAADSGPGTLRWCLENAVNGDNITFDPAVFPPTNPVIIALASELPWLTQGNITIDAGNAGVILDGSGTPESTGGLTITSDGNVIRGLQILDFPWSGIIIQGGQNNTVGGDRTVGTGPMGQGNLISGSQDANVVISGTGSDYNVITGNLIGTDPTGTFALRSTLLVEEEPTGVGVYAQSGAQHNVIGPGNVINCNNFGVQLYGEGTEDNIIIGNLIGTDISGTVAIGNFGSGIALSDGAEQNRVGGKTADERNIISGNEGSGIDVGDSRDNVIVGNFIGLDATGMHAMSNQGDGIMIRASDNRVGGKDAGERNIISGNGRYGVDIGFTGNEIIGNYIGTDASGTADLGNIGHGVGIELGAYNNLVDRNLISGNGREGVLIHDWGSSYNTVIGNLIGTDVSGTLPIPNCGGVGIGGGASFNRIGGTTTEERNIISGNCIGLGIGRAGPGNLVMGNFIGTDISGTSALGNVGDGVSLGCNHKHVFIERNVISGNGGDGIHLPGSGIDYNWVASNYIGTDASGTVAVGNKGDGISIYNGEHNIMQNNTIAYNKEAGVRVGSSAYNTLHRNSIHSHAGTGISISSSSNNTLYHNNFINNTIQAYDDGYTNSWDGGPVEGGNYWSDHVCEGNPSNGSQPYNISGGSNVDLYPFQDPNGWNKPPIANFTYSPENPTDLDKIQFNDTSTDLDGTIVSWYWGFGDENTSTEQNPVYRYADDGIYNVTLTVTDDDSATDTTSKEITVSNVAPTANFVFSPEYPVVNQTVIFDASNSTDQDGYILNYKWDFGDGNITSTTEETITHSYSSVRNYMVNLTVMDDDGATNSTNKTIRVYPLIGTFDTGKGTYPSIMGTHNGTIIPNQTITVSKLYTYPCSGTGGHSEHIRIYNTSGTLSEGHWNGYACDYHNITLTPSITLLKDHEYNYTIITGSYPQIHHTDRLEIDDGVITCTEFIDANGHSYNNWIPAIKLF